MYWIKFVLNAVFRIFHSEIPVKQNEFICHRNWNDQCRSCKISYPSSKHTGSNWINCFNPQQRDWERPDYLWRSDLNVFTGMTGFDFDRVSQSVEKNRVHLQSVTDRIKLAQARVQKIKGSKKATKVMRWFRHSVEEIRIESEYELWVGHKLIIKT